MCDSGHVSVLMIQVRQQLNQTQVKDQIERDCNPH